MKLEKISIKNFRTLENIEIDFNGYFSSISGKNNAGKTTLIKSIRYLLKENHREFAFIEESDEISYINSKTQWVKGNPAILFYYEISITKKNDPGLYNFVMKIAELEGLTDEFKLRVNLETREKNKREIKIFVNERKLKNYEAQEVHQRITSTNLAFFHNSTDGGKRMFFSSGMRNFHEMMLSKDEKEELKVEQERIKKKIKKFAQSHRGELAEMLGKLEEKYEVELTVFDRLFNHAVPLGINLKDKGLEVPLDDWGSGTQNRTQIMMSILQASRIKQQINDENRVTPIIIVEEPESFLHPSAQAEFGRVIRGLARDLKIQIVITSHSPYMLCQESPESNILLDRRLYRGRLKETQLVKIDKEKWMEPFSEILGLKDDAIAPWRDVVSTTRDNAILVEGTIDKEYLEHISSLGIKELELPENVEVIPYGGKDALKNSIMLKFVIEKFNRVYITFDLDVKRELSNVMTQLNLEDDNDYMAIGLDADGKDCIEGLLPSHVLSEVYSINTDLVMKMSSTDTNKRKSAKNELKNKLLENFKAQKSLDSSDLKNFKKIFSNFIKAFK